MDSKIIRLMVESNAAQALVFLYAAGVGAGMGVVYKLTHVSSRFSILMDLLFCLLAVPAALIFFLTVCDGLVRGYTLMGMIAGMLGTIRLCSAGIQRRKNGQNPSTCKNKKA